jgi:hypothetical protein
MMKFETTIKSPRSFDDTVKAIEQKAAEKGFRVLHTHDIAATLAEKGFLRKPLKNYRNLQCPLRKRGLGEKRQGVSHASLSD